MNTASSTRQPQWFSASSANAPDRPTVGGAPSDVVPTEMDDTFTDFDLQKDGELRVYVPADERGASVRMLPHADSRCEVFGAPMQPDVAYHVQPGAAFAVFAWTASVIRLHGSKVFRCSAGRCSITNYKALAELHATIHASRVAAQNEKVPLQRMGPRVVVTGALGTGKHTVAKTLANYGARNGWPVVLVDLDPCNSLVTVPGAVGAAVWEYPSSLDEGLMAAVTTSYFVGSTAIQQGGCAVSRAYSSAVNNVLEVMEQRLSAHTSDPAGWAGAIIVVPHLRGKAGADFIVDSVIERCAATHVISLGEDFFMAALLGHLEAQSSSLRTPVKGASAPDSRLFVSRGSEVTLFSLSPGTGPCRRSDSQTRRLIAARWREYFYGLPPHLQLQPLRFRRAEREVRLYSIVERSSLATATDGGVSYQRIDLTAAHLRGTKNDIAAVVDTLSEATAITASVLCYIHITEVDVVTSDVTFLSPVHESALPKPLMAIVGSALTWLQ